MKNWKTVFVVLGVTLALSAICGVAHLLESSHRGEMRPPLAKASLGGQSETQRNVGSAGTIHDYHTSGIVDHNTNPQPDKAAFARKTKKLQMPFIANKGQVDEQVEFYAKTFGGTVFVTKDGEIVYALPKSGDGEDGETHRKAAKCAKERGEKHISHKDTENTEEMIEGGPWRVQVCNLNPGVYLDKGSLFNQWRNQPDNLSSTQIGETWGSNCKFEPAMGIMGGMDKPCLPVLPVTTGHTGSDCSPLAGVVDGNFDGFASPACAVHADRLNPSSISLSSTSIGNPQSAIQNLSPTSIGDLKSGIALREEFVGAKVKTIQGEYPSITKVNYFKGSDPSKWKTNVSTYDVVSLGDIYDGIELRLKAYGNNVEKLFCVKPGAKPEQIKISLSGIQPPENPPPTPASGGQPSVPLSEGDKGGGDGIHNSICKWEAAEKSPLENGITTESPLKKRTTQISPLIKGEQRGLWVNEEGQLVAETELGPVKFTKPVAYQEIDGKRVEVPVEYRIQESKYKSQNSEVWRQMSEVRIKYKINKF